MTDSDILCVRTMVVNVVFVGESGAKTGEWVLVDTGFGFSAKRIIAIAGSRYGLESRPGAIVLTHGHFDHVGSAVRLADHWNVSVYAHELEIPYLTGQRDYPPPKPRADPGLMAKLSVFYPRSGIDLGDRVRALQPDGTIPYLPDWKWIHTPGHTPGHIALFRERDRALIAGDAFTTVRQESALSILSQRLELHGPPSYFTPEPEIAWESVGRLESLKPSFAVTGHGPTMQGDALTRGLATLVRGGPPGRR